MQVTKFLFSFFFKFNLFFGEPFFSSYAYGFFVFCWFFFCLCSPSESTIKPKGRATDVSTIFGDFCFRFFSFFSLSE